MIVKVLRTVISKIMLENKHIPIKNDT